MRPKWLAARVCVLEIEQGAVELWTPAVQQSLLTLSKTCVAQRRERSDDAGEVMRIRLFDVLPKVLCLHGQASTENLLPNRACLKSEIPCHHPHPQPPMVASILLQVSNWHLGFRDQKLTKTSLTTSVANASIGGERRKPSLVGLRALLDISFRRTKSEQLLRRHPDSTRRSCGRSSAIRRVEQAAVACSNWKSWIDA